MAASELYVYFIQADGDGPVRIGSSRDPHKTLDSLQGMNHRPITLLAALPIGGTTAEELHLRFHAHRMHSLWFHPAAPVMEYIRSLGRPPAPPPENVRPLCVPERCPLCLGTAVGGDSEQVKSHRRRKAITDVPGMLAKDAPPTWEDASGHIWPVPRMLGRLVRGETNDALKGYVLARDNETCAWCGTTDHIIVDHIISWRAGGSHHPMNLRALCYPCNMFKGATVDTPRAKAYRVQQFQTARKPHAACASPIPSPSPAGMLGALLATKSR